MKNCCCCLDTSRNVSIFQRRAVKEKSRWRSRRGFWDSVPKQILTVQEWLEEKGWGWNKETLSSAFRSHHDLHTTHAFINHKPQSLLPAVSEVLLPGGEMTNTRCTLWSAAARETEQSPVSTPRSLAGAEPRPARHLISPLIFLRDWYLHTQIYTALRCRSPLKKEGYIFPLS